MNVAGLDLSTKRIGLATTGGTLISIAAHAGAADPYRRLHELLRSIYYELSTHPPRPDLVVLEDYSLASPGRLSLVRLGELGGTVRLRLFELDLRFVAIPPKSVKLFATGNGNADKAKMVDAARQLDATPANDDEADAFHLRRMGRLAYGLDGGPRLPHEVRALADCGVAW